jgi:hypothetical protein
VPRIDTYPTTYQGRGFLIFFTYEETEVVADRAKQASNWLGLLTLLDPITINVIRAYAMWISSKGRRCLKNGKCLGIQTASIVVWPFEYDPDDPTSYTRH